MPKQVFDALKVILDEFGHNDLEPRLDWFAGIDDDRELGRKLLRAFDLVAAWHVHPNMDADDIRDSLEQSDSDWESDYLDDANQEEVTP
jgi:hypothetical protein